MFKSSQVRIANNKLENNALVKAIKTNQKCEKQN